MQKLSRRTVLRGVGAAVALPWLEAMTTTSALGRSATSDAAQRTLRNVFLYVPNGMHMPDWTPEREGKKYEATRLLKPIQAYRDKINVLSGLTLNGARALGDGGGDHARSVAAYLTGAHPKKTDGADIKNGQSVDQKLAGLVGQSTRLPSLELGMEPSAPAGRCDSGYSCVYTSNMSWRNEQSPVAKEVDPGQVFDRLFGTQKARTDQSTEKKQEKYRRSILDVVLDDAHQLEQRLGREDRHKLDEYLYAVRQVEKRLGSVETLRGKDFEAPDFPRPEGVPKEYEDHMKLMFDMMVLAMQTDSTRVISFMYANAGSNRSYRQIDVPEGHHNLSHHGNDEKKQEKIAKINEYHVTLLSYFLKKLEAVREGEHSLLDNSLVQYGSGIGDGNRHNHDDLPIVLIGEAAGRILTGQHTRFKKETPLTNLYLTMIQQAGGRDRKFGDSTDTIDGLFT